MPWMCALVVRQATRARQKLAQWWWLSVLPCLSPQPPWRGWVDLPRLPRMMVRRREDAAASSHASRLYCLLNASNLELWRGRPGELGRPPASCLGSATRCLGDGVFKAAMEPVLHTLCGLMLLTDGLLPAGSVLDVGAHIGGEACWYSSLEPSRMVHAVEPLQANVAYMQNLLPRWEAWGARNVTVTHAGLGREAITNMSVPRIRYRNLGQNMLTLSQVTKESDGELETFPLLTIDGIFEGERLALAHIDVEGQEYEVLLGARRTLARDRPWLTLETHTNTSIVGYSERDYRMAVHIGRLLGHSRYAVYVVDEACGAPGCRNLLCVPKGDVAKFEATEAFRLLHHRTSGDPRTSHVTTNSLFYCVSIEDKADALWGCLQESVHRVRTTWRMRQPLRRRKSARPPGASLFNHP